MAQTAEQITHSGGCHCGRVRFQVRSPAEIDLLAAGMICVDKDGDRARATVRSRLANRAHQNFRFTLETVPPEELPDVKKFMENFDVTRPLEERISDPNLVTSYLVRRFSSAGTRSIIAFISLKISAACARSAAADTTCPRCSGASNVMFGQS